MTQYQSSTWSCPTKLIPLWCELVGAIWYSYSGSDQQLTFSKLIHFEFKISLTNTSQTDRGIRISTYQTHKYNEVFYQRNKKNSLKSGQSWHPHHRWRLGFRKAIQQVNSSTHVFNQNTGDSDYNLWLSSPGIRLFFLLAGDTLIEF